MASIFDGLDYLIDRHLCLDPAQEGHSPQYKLPTAQARLCEEDNRILDGLTLVHELYDRMKSNWDTPSESRVDNPWSGNWRFQKQPDTVENQQDEDAWLARTIALITDQNWVGHVPVDSGVLGAHPHYIDLVYRCGEDFTFFELSTRTNTVLSAALQIMKYGLAYTFSRTHAELLGYKVEEKELLRAAEVNLRVLGPDTRYPVESGWLTDLETTLDDAVRRFAAELSDLRIRMSFRFEVFSDLLIWPSERTDMDDPKKDLLWALHRREMAFRDQAQS